MKNTIFFLLLWEVILMRRLVGGRRPINLHLRFHFCTECAIIPPLLRELDGGGGALLWSSEQEHPASNRSSVPACSYRVARGYEDVNDVEGLRLDPLIWVLLGEVSH